MFELKYNSSKNQDIYDNIKLPQKTPNQPPIISNEPIKVGEKVKPSAFCKTTNVR
ncbi:hypothetical protein NUITMVS3_42910 [Shewanella xiamenensis]|nr:hypothetical protein NUITMVS2_12810 [Shewanella xiamenensis]GLD79853.1 hypothetical protein NUITMVS3_42910 [Shewanella xiamenensis]